ncbi:S-layer homology domain-containing protein [Candidatus Gracilibacteria bacterium]|nr:S-layer homology domain-containing protein [Candidatus Gracilibacteria bacterium]
MKFYSLLTICTLSFLFTNISQARFSDAEAFPAWSYDAIDNVEAEGIMTGFGDGSFRAEKVLNRAEALVLIFRTKGLEYENTSTRPQFSDVPEGEWFSDAVAEAANQGWITGFPDGTFRPGQELNRAEFSVILMRAFDMEPDPDNIPVFEDVPSQSWFAGCCFLYAQNELIRRSRVRDFRPEEGITRAEAAWMISEILGKPRLMGTSGDNDYYMQGVKIDSRRTAVKPRDFNPNKQGYDIDRSELKIFTEANETPVQITPTSDWTHIGNFRIANSLEYYATVKSFELRFRFERDDMGPERNFMLRLKGTGFEKEMAFDRNGGLFLSGLSLRVNPEEEYILRVEIKPMEGVTYFSTPGIGTISGFTLEAESRQKEDGGSIRYSVRARDVGRQRARLRSAG